MGDSTFSFSGVNELIVIKLLLSVIFFYFIRQKKSEVIFVNFFKTENFRFFREFQIFQKFQFNLQIQRLWLIDEKYEIFFAAARGRDENSPEN